MEDPEHGAVMSTARCTTAPGHVRIGCSGWSYRAWRGRFYPEDLASRRWFQHYASVFDTVELNATFYCLPAVTTVEAWAAQAPPGFCYAMKLGAFGTHRKKLRDPEGWLARHLERARLLGDALGPTLVQLPPRWGRDVARLDEFLDVCPRDLRWAVEVRDPSWLHDEVYDVLRRHGAALCWHDLLPDVPIQPTTDWVYVRLHGAAGPAAPYHGTYGERRLRQWADRARVWRDAGLDVHVYFDNDVDAAAPSDARLLRRLVGDAMAVSPHRV